MLDERVNCMSCLCADQAGIKPGVTTAGGITHAMAVSGFGYLFRLCDFGREGVLRPGLWPTARVHADDEPPASCGSQPPE